MNASTVEVICKCGQTFTARVADRNRGWGKFCSKSCKSLHHVPSARRRLRARAVREETAMERFERQDREHDEIMNDCESAHGQWE